MDNWRMSRLELRKRKIGNVRTYDVTMWRIRIFPLLDARTVLDISSEWFLHMEERRTLKLCHAKATVSSLLQCLVTYVTIRYISRYQWPCGLKRRCTASRQLRLWVWIPPRAWMALLCVLCYVRCQCDALIKPTDKSYRLWRVVVCDLETSRMRRPWPALGRSATGGNPAYYLIAYEASFYSLNQRTKTVHCV